MDVKIAYEKQPDGSEWKRYNTPSGVQVLVTQAFRELIKTGENIITGDFQRSKKIGKFNQIDRVEYAVLKQIREILNIADRSNKGFLNLLRFYRSSYESGLEDDGVREFINKGGEASFFGIGESNIGVREEEKVRKYSEEKIHRMNMIKYLLELGGLPHWIKTPIHYGMVSIPRDIYERGATSSAYDKFLIMQKVDSGISVFDIVQKPRSDKLANAIKKEFGFESFQSDEYRAFQEEIAAIFDNVKKQLHETCLKFKDQLPEGTNFENLFTDLLDRNMLVSMNSPPIALSKYSFWIIDQ